MAHFEIKDLSFCYPAARSRLALNNVSLTIEQGEYVTVCGRSGSGKTTLLRHLKSVLAPHGKIKGQILFDGRPLKEVDLREQASRIGYVMQNPDNQIVTDKVWHELAFGLESLGCDQKTIRLRVAEMASYFGIQDWFHKNVSELSGGQKQLLNLASIMAMQPSVLILDEPTSQLDPIAASDFLNTVRKINRELRTTIIITEHRLEDIFYASDCVIVMEDGKVIANDRPERIGEFLKGENNRMFAAMPTPVQIYYGVQERCAGSLEVSVEGAGKSAETATVAAKQRLSELACPLTVREGAEWLDKLFAGVTITETKVDKGQKYIEEDIKNPAVELQELWFRYEKDSPDILKGVSLKVPKNSLFAIVGGNGTGKSTTLKAISGICRPYRGKVLIDGKKIDKYKSGELFRGMLAMLPQDPQSLFVHKTVKEDLAEMLPRKLSEAERKARIAQVAETCEITELLDSHPYDLSGGEQQRAALAKVLLTEPKILLLDEPTKGIDSFFKLKFAEIMAKLKGQGVTIIMVSHDVEFCARYADTVSMFFDGGIVTTNTPNRFFSGNSFYTTAANRMSRHLFENTITNEEVIALCQKNL
ncbi:MAG: ATP-binding cassette domain-containing protein [Lachnospiraceae bacterium]|nr:ATP-binding cassette domain-containing protein [Lachnospiraceae bacterium]